MGHDFDPERLLQAPLMANLATLSPEGPRNSPVWYIWEEGALWMLGSRTGGAVRRLEQDPRAAVEIVDFDRKTGKLAHLGLRGCAEILPMDPARFRRLLALYLGPDEAAWNPWFVDNIARIDDPDGRLIRLDPDTIFTNNVSYFLSGPALSWPTDSEVA